MFLPMSVCVSVYPLDCSKSYEHNLINFWKGYRLGPRNNRLDFGDDQDHDAYPHHLLQLRKNNAI